jgi:hypothetical protein
MYYIVFMKRAFDLTKQDFESSSGKTPQYLTWHRLFKSQFKKFLASKGAIEIEIGRPNHFDISGFFKMGNNQIWYFSISDVRWSKQNMLIRTAQSFKDYAGGHNMGLCLTGTFENFEREFDDIMRNNFP